MAPWSAWLQRTNRATMCLFIPTVCSAMTNWKPYNVYTRAKQLIQPIPGSLILTMLYLLFLQFQTEAYGNTAVLIPYATVVDQDLYLKLAEQGAFLFITDVFYRYRMHRTGYRSATRIEHNTGTGAALLPPPKEEISLRLTIFLSRYVRRQEFEQLKKSVTKQPGTQNKKNLFGR